MSSQSSSHRRSSHRSTSSFSNSARSITRPSPPSTITRIKPSEYNPNLYSAHLFIMRLIPPPICSPHSHSHQGKITASSIPQWEWSVEQCREWFERVLVRREGLGKGEAREMARRLDVDGRGIYGLGREGWLDVCEGDDAEEIARRVFGMLRRRRREEGALPVGMMGALRV